MKITNIQLKQSEEHNLISAQIDDFNLWYKFPKEIMPEVKADAFIAACLIPSMKLGSDIFIDEDIPVSIELLENIENLQIIFSSWGKHLGHKLNIIKIKGGKKTKFTAGWDKTISFFSGGIDGTFTYLKHKQEIDYLLFAKGIDMQLSSDELYNEALSKNKDFLNKEGKEVIPFETNVRFLGHQYGVGWSTCFGGGLSSIALAAGAKKCYIASGVTYACMHPEGSNFITDHLWSNGFTQIIHDGAESSRVNKLKQISKNENALNILRVCWHDNGYNCGNCEKCLRTMTNLRVLKLQTPTFKPMTDQLVKTKLSKIKIYSAIDMEFIEENLAEAIKINDHVLINVLKKIKKNYELRSLLNHFDHLFLNNFLKKIKLKLFNRT